MKSNKSTIGKIGIGIFLIVGIITYLVFSQNGYKEYEVGESYKSLFSVLGNVVDNDGEIKIIDEDINSLGTSYFQTNGNLGELKIKGLNIELGENEVGMKIPVEYKNLPLLLSTKGKIGIDDKYLIYTPEYFKVGKIKLSSNFILGFIQKKFSEKFILKDSNILFDKSKLFKEFEFVKAEKGAIILVTKDEGNENIQKVKEAMNKVKEEADKQVSKEVSVDEDKNSAESKAGSKTGSNQVEKKKAAEESVKEKEIYKQASFTKVKSNLGSLSSKVSGGKQQQMVSIMSDTVNKMSGDPNYNFWSNANKVISIYKTLPPQERKTFKDNFYKSMDMNNILNLKSKYGM